MLKQVEMPKGKVREERSSDQMRDDFRDFYKLANAMHQVRQLGVKKADKEELHWKDEMYAIINPNDFDKYQDAVGFMCGSPLEVEEKISDAIFNNLALNYGDTITQTVEYCEICQDFVCLCTIEQEVW